MLSRRATGTGAGNPSRGKSAKRSKEELSLLERYVRSAPWENDSDGPDERRARGETYLFTFRSNVMYSGRADPNPCVYGEALDIVPNDYIKVVAVVDDYWWVGRLVGGSAVCKYVPSPKCFKEKHEASKVKVRREDSVARVDSGEDDPPGTRPRMDSVGNKTSVKGMFGADQSGPKRSQKSFRVKSGERLKEGQYTRQPVRTLPVYDLAPDVRPLVIVGPSAPGYEVTDKMQYALVSYLLMSFSQHCVKVIVDDESGEQGRSKNKSVGSGGGLHLTSEKMNEIFLIGSSGKVPILITMHQNVDALRFSPLMPIIVQIRIPSAKVLSKLIKTRHDQSGMQLQLNYTEKLNTMNHNNFDVILVHSKLDESCYELAAYIDAYLQDIKTDPVIDPKVWHAVDEASSSRPRDRRVSHGSHTTESSSGSASRYTAGPLTEGAPPPGSAELSPYGI